MNKGQMFLILALIMIVAIVLLRINADLPSILRREEELRARLEEEFFQNIVEELTKVVEISYHQPGNITRNVFDFGNFTRKKMTERMQEFEFLFVGCITPKSSGLDTMNVSVINLLNKPINLTLTLNSSPPQTRNQDNMVDQSRYDTSFSIVQGTDYILMIEYNRTYEENITIRTEVGESKYVGFFDVTLVGEETTYKDKFQESYTLP